MLYYENEIVYNNFHGLCYTNSNSNTIPKYTCMFSEEYAIFLGMAKIPYN